MKEILFRGKRLDNGEWVEGGYKHEKVGEYLTAVFIIEHLTSEVWENHRVDPATVGQHTGLKDKNGKRIFEGDILRIMERGGVINGGIVIFENGYPGGWLVTEKDRNSKCSLAMRNDVEVIGNIHDNPEMIGGDTP